MIRHFAVALTIVAALAACSEEPPVVEPYPFAGQWDCGVSVMTLSATSYDSGGGPVPISSVTRNGPGYELRLGDGRIVALAAVTDTALTWVSGQTGQQFTCLRL
jgi:hypothetical protein